MGSIVAYVSRIDSAYLGAQMRVALIHYWLLTQRGGEKVLQALAEIFPQADIYAHVIDHQVMAKAFPGHRLIETAIGRLPLGGKGNPVVPSGTFRINVFFFDQANFVLRDDLASAHRVVIEKHRPSVFRD